MDSSFWPYLPTLQRLALALAVGLFVGLEREHQHKEAGLRTFGFVAVLGALGGLLGTPYGLLALGLVGVLIVLLNLDTLRTGEGAELTTSAALIVTGFTGLLAGQGHTFTPTALAVIITALLAWKKPLSGFSRALTDAEIRSAILLAILAFVVYPALPHGNIDPWSLIALRPAWIIVILIAALGFVNYVLLKLYGDRGLTITGLLGGLVNSTLVVTELATRSRKMSGQYAHATYQGIILASTAMLVRNIIILGIFAPAALLAVPMPFVLMLIGTIGLVFLPFRQSATTHDADSASQHHGETSTHGNDTSTARGRSSAHKTQKLASFSGLASPFSITAALKFGVLFLTLQVIGTLALRLLGQSGLYAVSAVGGLVSSSSAVASVAGLAARGTVSANVAGLSAVLAALSSLAIGIPIVARLAGDRMLVRKVIVARVILCGLGIAGAVAQSFLSQSFIYGGGR
jgi:uncharacterized membrane protein (DUF4010 family)